ncbi:hypothetical protein CEXT_313591 [Caerostris extrusa]|uniref:Uncharacterized protein n=1 Tax=Caerostris extrusa TaxID=172846 RepID=A0AAV4W818_CAEEX|nr:hypothetical protein CEXT_313591 [Caerostris extrusa]
MPAAAPLRLRGLFAGDWSFLITELGTLLGTYLAIRSLPISIESVHFPGGLILESSRDSQLGGVNFGPPLRIHGGGR